MRKLQGPLPTLAAVIEITIPEPIIAFLVAAVTEDAMAIFIGREDGAFGVTNVVVMCLKTWLYVSGWLVGENTTKQVTNNVRGALQMTGLKAWRNHFIINLIGALQSIWYAIIPPSWTGHDSATVNDLAHMTITRSIEVGSSSPPDDKALHHALSAMYADYLGLSEHNSFFADSMVVAEWVRYCRASNRHPIWCDKPWSEGSVPVSLGWVLQRRS